MAWRMWARGRGLQIGDGRRHARMPQIPLGLIGGGGAPPFASFCQTEVRSTIVSTSSTTTYVNALTLTTPVLQAGDYWLAVFAYYSQDAGTEGDCQLQLTQNGGEIANNRGHSDGTGVSAQDGKNLFVNARILTLPAAVATFALNFRVGAPSGLGDDAAVFWARLNLWSF